LQTSVARVIIRVCFKKTIIKQKMDRKLEEKRAFVDKANKIVSQLSQETIKDESKFISLVNNLRLPLFVPRGCCTVRIKF
jgi:formiminotetrahydrofolate cyclodeaminase